MRSIYSWIYGWSMLVYEAVKNKRKTIRHYAVMAHPNFYLFALILANNNFHWSKFHDRNSMTVKEYVAADTWTNKFDEFTTFKRNNNKETGDHRGESKIEEKVNSDLTVMMWRPLLRFHWGPIVMQYVCIAVHTHHMPNRIIRE